MDTVFIADARFAALCVMLFTTIVAITAEEPEAVPAVFQKIWLRCRLFHETRRIRSSEKQGGRFWEIDMTRLEP